LNRHEANRSHNCCTVPYERGSTIVTSNLPFDEWTGVFGSERLTGALLDRLTHHVQILEMNGDSYRLKQSKQRQRET
jgi:DNA replication protein DnaC